MTHNPETCKPCQLNKPRKPATPQTQQEKETVSSKVGGFA